MVSVSLAKNEDFYNRLMNDTLTIVNAEHVRRTDNQRLDYIIAHVYKHHLDNGTDVDENMKSFVRRLGNDDDTAGQIISKKLGGSGSLSFNVFPQSPNFDVSRWQRVQDEVYNEVKDRIFSILEIYLIYKNDAATRPRELTVEMTKCISYYTITI